MSFHLPLLRRLCLALLPVAGFSQAPTSIESRFPLLWEQRVGLTTFRTNLQFAEGFVIAPSNGISRNNLLDPEDGLWLLDPRSGAVVYRIHPTGNGDTDVNGVAIHKGRLYFGNDLGQVFCTSISGNEVWTAELPGDIEGSPVLTDLNGDGTPDCVVASEDPAEVVALDGKTGNVIWRFTPRDFGTFMATPAAFDFTGDGVDDIFLGLAGGRAFYGINGANGRQMWRYQTIARAGLVDGSAIHGAATVYLEPGKKPLLAVAEVYGTLHYIDGEGRAARFLPASVGIFSTPVFSPKGTAIFGSSWQDRGLVHVADAGPAAHWKEGRFGTRTLDWQFNQKLENTGKVSASAVVADALGDGSWQLLIPTERGELLVFSEAGELLERLALPAGAEATPLVADVNDDGRLELLLATLDGVLRCYQLPGTDVFWGSFRGGATNVGVWRPLPADAGK